MDNLKRIVSCIPKEAMDALKTRFKVCADSADQKVGNVFPAMRETIEVIDTDPDKLYSLPVMIRDFFIAELRKLAVEYGYDGRTKQ